MTDPGATPGPTTGPTTGVAAPAPGPPPTGVSIVDDVLAGLEGVERQPVEDRVPAFERAHEGLSAALDDPGDTAGA